MATYWEIAAHSAYETFSWYKYLIDSLFFWSGSLFLIAPFPDRCLLVPFFSYCVTSKFASLICQLFKKSSGKHMSVQ